MSFDFVTITLTLKLTFVHSMMGPKFVRLKDRDLIFDVNFPAGVPFLKKKKKKSLDLVTLIITLKLTFVYECYAWS